MKNILTILALTATFPLTSMARDHGDFQRREPAKQEAKSCCEDKGTCCTKECCSDRTGSCCKDGVKCSDGRDCRKRDSD